MSILNNGDCMFVERVKGNRISRCIILCVFVCCVLLVCLLVGWLVDWLERGREGGMFELYVMCIHCIECV